MKDPRPEPASGDFSTTPLGDGLTLFAWMSLLLGLGAGTGALFAPDAWYLALLKPTFNPPAWLFGPVWSALYLMMAVALWLVRRDRDADPVQRRRASTLFAVQFVLNLLWTPLFFGLHSPGLAFVDICLLWIALLTTMLAFGRVRPLAGYLLLPYLLWVSFALVLNGTIWLMNA
ncbi:TspO/MBR family protein [Lysobacter hankyongensis]|uniref:Tryptophan-rich sensory protein n=1 Tax=Lysobacter hankyongensis TaxID=1176535 RepID=A0ABP9B1U3_9GAMM